MANATAAATTGTSAAILSNGLLIYGPMLLLGFVLFECVRCRWLYEVAPKSPLPDGLFRWIPFVLRLTDDELMDKCGLETLMFLRFVRVGKKLALMGAFLSIALFPPQAHWVDRLTIGGLTDGDKRLWATVLAAFGITLTTMYLIYDESVAYKERRHEFLSKLDTQQYSVLIDDLPLHLRSHAALKKYLDTIFPHQVEAVYIAVESGELEARVAERIDVRASLEHALVLEAQCGRRPTHYQYDPHSMWYHSKVDSIAWYRDRLHELNDDIRISIAAIEAQQKNGSVQFNAKQAQLLATKAHFEAQPLESTPLLPKQAVQQQRQQVAFDLHVAVDEAAAQFEHASNVLRSAAFVAFSTLQATNTIQQIVQTARPSEMKVQEAPPAEDIVWENVGRLNYVERKTALLLSIGITGLAILFWTVPTTFVVALASVCREHLRQVIPNLDSALVQFPFLQPLLQQLSPLLLVVMNSLAPLLFRILSVGEGHASQNAIEASLFTKYVAYQLVQVFFVSAIAGSISAISDQLARIAKEPLELVTLLGSSLPGQSTFFFSFILVQTGLTLHVHLFRLVAIVLGSVYSLLAPQLTPRETNAPWYGLVPMTASTKFDITIPLAQHFLIFLIVLTFAPLAPLLAYMGGVFFFVSDIVFRRLAWCVFQPSTRSTGVYWPQLYVYLITALGIAQITLLGLLTLKEAPSQVLAALLLPAATALFHGYMLALFPPVSAYLPIEMCVALDDHRARLGHRPPIDANLYKQPAMLAATPLSPEV
ncbi:hypothetical protein SPRG_21067 [Saprolegnia parasitica CBS 223.65]|uniref:CSC1/OSCA1-like 7TM region domain-containing protein n=1 Tax=Saprolegnia parasitica (strain CBS 223.65) TaxID=695850 RepID=A0A067C1T4_SAPPC|nr:hypothetical protein SPRG_21067 [Saprolegnia parasitica CBS 223.65]KDO23090.1 hypothetical protein SPRG_21067 [Saprolegnia parasitica CBS 223.65]|eukprot:XP_012206243.1 hypothetical protein SPRG_21067 [Saprolegnia parasitica CBS 223.65]